ncbi:hypothetical protein EDF60_2866 [Leucobacter luti]|nr:hypothetical protein [Leucobacter luti]TCK35490.1 hypothetical protein EDF60_2866 [Leucobacter luti]
MSVVAQILMAAGIALVLSAVVLAAKLWIERRNE